MFPDEGKPKLSLYQLKEMLEEKVLMYNNVHFIENDPIYIPHQFSKKQDIEIAGFWAAILAWGQRKTIISKSLELFKMMDNAPHDFILNHSEQELTKFEKFKHRTFNSTDALYFIAFFKYYYSLNNSLEKAFADGLKPDDQDTTNALIHFHNIFFSLEFAPSRTKKHVSTPAKNTACKRINMFLRWMVRKDNNGVDFGIWNQIKPSQLVCPCDVHVDRISRQLGLISRKKTDWLTALELTHNLKMLDKEDPVKYDFALFGMGVHHGNNLV